MKQLRQLKRYTIVGILFVLFVGTLSHFLYEWTGRNVIVGLFVPVNESVWEHMKLLFFPMLLYSAGMAFKLKASFPCVVFALCFGILIGTACIPVFFYVYTFILGTNVFVLDLAIFLFGTVIAFLTAYLLTRSCRFSAYTGLLCVLVCILFLCFAVFTYYPPDLAVFIPMDS